MEKSKTSLKKNEFISFSKWNNKIFSVFNSLKKIVRISTLSVAYSIILTPVQLIAQTDTSKIFKTLDIEEIIVSAQRAPVIYSKLARTMTVIDEQTIKIMPVTSINELIENNSFVDIRQRGTNGVQADMSIRGGTFDQNLILLNGINISDPQTGHHSLNIPLNFNAIDRIEILEGSASRVFGPNAFSGAVNILTNQSNKNFIKTNFSAGDFALYSASFSGAINYKKTGHFLAASKSVSGGYASNTDYDQMNVFYNPYFKFNKSKINFQIGHTNNSFGANSFYTPEYPDQYEQIKTTFASVKFESESIIKYSTSIYYREHKDRFELFRYEPASWYAGHNYHYTQVYGSKIDARYSWKFGTTSVGAEYRSENILSNKLGEQLNDTIFIDNEPDGFYTKSYSRSITNIFIEQTLYLNELSISAGILASYVADKENNVNFYPGIDLSYKIFEGLNVIASINKSLRLPTFTDLFYEGPNNIGNPDLKPETAWSFDGGFKYDNQYMKSNISVFYRDAENLIEWVKEKNAPLGSKWETQNLTNVQTSGIQVYVKTNPIEYLTQTPIKSIYFNYSYINQTIDSKKYESKYSLNYLKQNFNLSIYHKLIKNIDILWNFKYQDRAGYYVPYDKVNNVYEPETEFKPFFLVDAKLIVPIYKFNVYAEASNIFNVKYIDYGNISMPERWFKAGIEFNFYWN
ncbi:MAG: hypothetical protein A2041_12525 [Bacteroidetes bacterium GWA2_31_9b]|nr:MAG: hypothetical protein A2041_12525 [Bacteroidetes bacterium GWA2_31_9b]